MKSLIVFAIFLFFIATESANAQTLYACNAQYVVNIDHNGVPSTPKKGVIDGFWSDFLIDTASGVLMRPNFSIPAEHWTVLQRRRNTEDDFPSNDFVASADPLNASAQINLLRIRDWKRSPQPIFIFTGLAQVVTGTCELFPK